MKCPFLQELQVAYCAAFPVKKLIPLKDIHTLGPCVDDEHWTCPTFKDSCPDKAEKPGGSLVVPIPTEEQKECVWLHQPIVSYRLCVNNYNCERCPFEQQLADIQARYEEPPELVDEIKRLKALPGPYRKCKYMIMGTPRSETCPFNYKCWQCQYYRKIRDRLIPLIPRR